MNQIPILTPAVGNPSLDGATPVFEMVGADPSAGAGLDRPPGSIALFATNWYWKFGKLATNWLINPFNSGGGGGGATVATWAIGTATPRYFAIDPTNGSDASAGFSDVSAAAAWAVAKKTFAGFAAIVPTVGAGRSFVLLNGAATMGEDFSLGLVSGYDNVHVIGTTDGSDSAADRILSGAVVASAGPGAGGVWTCVAGGAVGDIKVAAGLPSETGATGVTLWRVRFAANTTTAGLRNVCVGIWANTATDITPCSLLGTAPAAGDTFFIERPGVLYKTVAVGLQPARLVWFRGIASSDAGAWSTFSSATQILTTFCESRIDSSVSIGSCRQLLLQQTHTSIGASVATSTLGGGFRAQGQLGIANVASLSGNNSGSVVGQSHPTFQSSISKIPAMSFGQGCVWNGPAQLSQVGQGAAARITDPTFANTQAQFGGVTTSFQPWRIFNAATPGLAIEACTMLVRDGTSLSTGEGIRVGGDGNVVVFTNIAGANPDVGVDLQPAHNSQFVFVTCTIAGVNGTIALPGAANVTHADLTHTNIVDVNGNDTSGAGGHVVDQCGYGTVSDPDGIATGEPIRLDTATLGDVTHADFETADNAACVGIAVCGAAQTGAIYYATGGTPYVLNSGAAIAAGALAYVATGPAGIGVVTSTVPPVGKFKQRLGRWVAGVAGTSGFITFQPELIGVAADGGP